MLKNIFFITKIKEPRLQLNSIQLYIINNQLVAYFFRYLRQHKIQLIKEFCTEN